MRKGDSRAGVRRQVNSPSRDRLLFITKSTRSRRTVALDEETVRVVREHREAQVLERDFAGPAYQDCDLVFATALGTPIQPGRATERFRELRKGAGLPAGSLHVLRHTAATLALTSGVRVHIVAARLGDNPGTVLAAYAHVLPQSDELAAETVAALVSTS
jgi:integrase